VTLLMLLNVDKEIIWECCRAS